MNEMKPIHAMGSRAWWAVALVGAALTLTACDKADNRTAGEKVDSAIAKTEKAANDAKDKTEQMASDAKAKMESSGATAKVTEAVKDAGAAVSGAADDATITAAVSSRLAKDPDLSAIKIDVDTKAGNVTLTGPAPTAAAKSRAEEIAKNVKGVSSVDNKLDVKM
ncbi:BON domain-containing protein [Variovorax sp. J22R133]|uniref:BON domain-containing protein n=1 Tax=Variovorax brevis TaxID=3053503 RepID=UPI002574C1FD|nr:BON domain-containing protein [Variovorax sp. J22R133]MDM0112930.1 BON domain-containing protein [Variovorax sp. J22R133]